MRTKTSLIVDYESKELIEYGSLRLLRPTMWVDKASEDENDLTRWAYNVDEKETCPQLAEVIVPNEKYPYKKGDMIFLHYLAYGNSTEIDGYRSVEGTFIFFKVNLDGSFTMADNTFLGEQVYSEAIKTDTGIYLTSQAHKKETLQIRITHAPEWIVYDNYGYISRRRPQVQVGDIVITPDDYQYYLNYEGKQYIKLLDREIVATIEQV